MTQINYFDILRRMKILCWMFLIATFALKLFGFELFGVDIQNEKVIHIFTFIDNNDWLRIILNFIKGFISLNIIFWCVIKPYREHSFKINCFIFSHLALTNILTYYGLVEFVFITAFLIYLVPLLFVENKWYCLYIFVIDIAFQSLSILTLNISFVDYQETFLISVLLSIDYLTMWIIKSFDKKEVIEWQLSWVGEQVSLEKIKQLLKNVLQSMKICLSIQTIKLKLHIITDKLKSLMLSLKMYLKFDFADECKDNIVPITVIFTVYIIFAYFMGKMWEAVYVYVAYLAIRKMFPKHFHADHIPNIKKELISITCIILTSFMLCFALYQTMFFSFSIFSTILIAFVVDFILFVFRDWLDFKVWYNRKEKLKKELIDLGFSQIKIEIATLHIVDLFTFKDIASQLGYSEQTCKNYFSEVLKAKPELKRK